MCPKIEEINERARVWMKGERVSRKEINTGYATVVTGVDIGNSNSLYSNMFTMHESIFIRNHYFTSLIKIRVEGRIRNVFLPEIFSLFLCEISIFLFTYVCPSFYSDNNYATQRDSRYRAISSRDKLARYLE